jgi:hypothetical protein
MGGLPVLLLVILLLALGGVAVFLLMGALVAPGDTAGGLAILGILLLGLCAVIIRALLGQTAPPSAPDKPHRPPDRRPPPDAPIPPP